MITLGVKTNEGAFLEDVNHKSGCNILECYQCGKCASTCPVASFMDYNSRQIMQMIKVGMKEEVYTANSMWYCLTCAACSGRCPREIDIPRVMETLRQMAVEEKLYSKSKKVADIKRFHELFLSMVKKYGRGWELRLMAEFNIRTRNFFKDVMQAPVFLTKGKLPLLPNINKNMKGIKKMFEISEKIEKEHNNKK